MVIGSEFTWHGAPDCHCDVTDLLNLDRVEEEESDTESPGAKTLVEGKPRQLGPRHLYQTMGNAVTYRYNRCEHQNPLVPVVGISGGHGTFQLCFMTPCWM